MEQFASQVHFLRSVVMTLKNLATPVDSSPGGSIQAIELAKHHMLPRRSWDYRSNIRHPDEQPPIVSIVKPLDLLRIAPKYFLMVRDSQASIDQTWVRTVNSFSIFMDAAKAWAENGEEFEAKQDRSWKGATVVMVNKLSLIHI